MILDYRKLDDNYLISELSSNPRPHGWKTQVISDIKSNCQWLESVCPLFEFGFVNFWLKFESRDDWFLRDGLHLTEEGARVLARGVNRAVKDFCSLN